MNIESSKPPPTDKANSAYSSGGTSHGMALRHRSPKPSSFNRFQLPLRWVLVVPFVLQVSIAVGITGFLSIRNGQKTVEDLSAQLMQATTYQVNQLLTQYLSVPIEISRHTAYLVESEILDPQDFQQMGHYFWGKNQNHPTISYVGLGLKTGEYIGAGDWLEDYDLVIDQANAKGDSQSYAVDEIGNRTGVVHEYKYRVTEEDWYLQAVASDDPVWLLAIEDIEPAFIAAGISQAVYSEDGSLIGVIDAHLTLSDISQFLAPLLPDDKGQLFIIERDGFLVASSQSDEIFDEAETTISRVNSLVSTNAITQIAAQKLQQSFGTFGAIQSQQLTQVDIQGQRHFVQVTPWQNDYGLDWLVVAVVPKSTFTAEIWANTRLTIYFCLLALAIAIGIGLITSRWISHSVFSLSQASQDIAEAARQQQPQFLSQTIYSGRIQELAHLAISFQQMGEQLQQSFSDLEQTNVELENRVEDRTADLSEAIATLKRTQAQLVQTEKMSGLGRMVAGIAHEINNPVNFIHGNLQPLQEHTQSILTLIEELETAHPALAQIIQAKEEALDLDFIRSDLPQILASMKIGTNRIRNIVQSLRNFSRLDEADVKAVDLHEGIESTLLMLQHLLKVRGDRADIQVIRQYAKIPLVECHAGQLNQVFMNLLANAIDAIHEASKDPTWLAANPGSIITIQTALQPDNTVTISIADNAQGLSDKACRNLFTPFFTTKPVGKGTGMGLYISYQIVTVTHHGQLTYRSTPGTGTTFVIQLPVKFSGVS